jgi:hypothetical protein
MAGTILPIMQFANSDIEDLKIVDEEQTSETSKQQSYSKPVVSSPPSSQQPSIHDDPAIVSAVISSASKDHPSNSSISSRLIHNLQQMTLSDEQSKNEGKHNHQIKQRHSLLSIVLLLELIKEKRKLVLRIAILFPFFFFRISYSFEFR